MIQPAFPVSTRDPVEGHPGPDNTWQFPGMTLRDYFAAKALSGFLAHPAQDEAPLRESNFPLPVKREPAGEPQSYRPLAVLEWVDAELRGENKAQEMKARHAAAKGEAS